MFSYSQSFDVLENECTCAKLRNDPHKIQHKLVTRIGKDIVGRAQTGKDKVGAAGEGDSKARHGDLSTLSVSQNAFGVTFSSIRLHVDS